MASQDNGAALSGVEGRKHLYVRPELLTPEVHGKLGFRRAERPFDFVRDTIALPITAVEFAQAQRNFPIVFSDIDNPVPLAVMGLPGGGNLFVDENGRWDKSAYVPGYMRCHPLALAPQADGRVAVVIDAAASCVSEEPEFPFFVDGKPSPRTEEMISFCGQFEAERKKTQAFCSRMKELGLLAVQRVATNPGADDETPLADFVAIDTRKLSALDDATVVELHRNGYLLLAYLQSQSTDNWRRLVTLKKRQQNA
jgi:hypothetical protein